jgi:hypothetical protein
MVVNPVEDTVDVGLVAVEQVVQAGIVVRNYATADEGRKTLDAVLKAKEPAGSAYGFGGVPVR